ncbi:hypothetical protein HGRIS_006242 [Hohenbuehelia grisea]|uniref:Uncharacterized protein n=1 Tax=Hohenbuehelia grisea TaxID=104357 RepID=A0ABR3K062_9AGAR
MHLLRTLVTAFPLLAIQTCAAQKAQKPVNIQPSMADGQWSSRYAGWHARAQPHPNPSSFEPTRETLAFAVLRNAQADHDGFTLALFKPTSGSGGIAVDAAGKVLEVAQDDFAGLESLAQNLLTLPKSEGFRNTWVLERDRTSQPIERILVPREGSTELTETGVQGFAKGISKLKYPVDGHTDLPAAFAELAGLILEGRDDYVRGGEDSGTIGRVKNVLGDAV